MSPKRGHATAKTTLRTDEVALVVQQTVDLEAERLQRLARQSAPYETTEGGPWTRTGFYRAAIRFALAHPEDFRAWLSNTRDPR